MAFALLTRLRAGPDADLSHFPVSLDLRAVSLAEGVRAALAVATIIAINEWAGIPALGETALGALLTCLCDPGGPIRRRLPPLLTFAVLGAAITIAFSMLREFNLVLVALVAAALIFCNSLARVWGQVGLQLGNLLTVVTVLALDHPEPPAAALILGAMFLAGSLWAVVLALLIWRLYPYRPARRAVSEVFRRLAALAGDLSEQVARETAPDWAAHARAHRRYVRDGIETARGIVFGSIRGRGQASPRGSALLIQIETADQLFGALIALSDVLEAGGPAACDAARPLLPALRLLLAAIADGVLDERGSGDAARRAMLEHLIGQLERGRANPALAGIVGAIVERVRIAALMTTPEGQLAETMTPEAGAGDRLAPLRANLTWNSAALRHATRAAVVAVPALLITLSSGEAYAHWLTNTLVLTLQPFFGLTWQRALERIGGTMLGGVAAAAIAAVIHTPVATAAVLFPLTILAFAVRYVGFGLFMAAMTPLVVLLSEIGQPGQSELAIAAWRAGYTALGGIMAIVGGTILWPSWEPVRLREELRRAIAAHGAFADLTLGARLGESAAGLEPARRAAGLATNNLEASLSRAMQEPPGLQARDELRAAMVADAALRRMAGRLTAFQYGPEHVDDGLLRRWRSWLAAAFAALETGAPLPGPPPESAQDGSLARIGRQIELMAGAQHPGGAEQPEAPTPPAPP